MASIRAALLICFASTGLCGFREQAASVATPAAAEVGKGCFPAEAIEVGFDGHGRLAFVVGGDYEKEASPDREGPLNNASRFRDLLTRPVFRFFQPNVCVPLNDQATTAAFKGAFEELISKACATSSATS
jgi:hypothetical protein